MLATSVPQCCDTTNTDVVRTISGDNLNVSSTHVASPARTGLQAIGMDRADARRCADDDCASLR
ncbi:hypothetical protein [Gluconacetobacter sacchari]|uniref:hypothetical protein n=1 Tax=Gluconacetobacter sacchari TaxID=92759 RepID=UPI002230DBBC|nr:hypothetical protein [Gluconacetobacter sacchari]